MHGRSEPLRQFCFLHRAFVFSAWRFPIYQQPAARIYNQAFVFLHHECWLHYIRKSELNKQFVLYKYIRDDSHCWFVPNPMSMLYNKFGGELTVEDLLNLFGRIVKDARHRASMAQDALAEQAGVTTRYIMAIENENKHPSMPVLFKIIRILKISADMLPSPERYD